MIKQQSESVKLIQSNAEKYQKSWLCPSGGHTPDKRKLSKRHLFTLEAVENYTRLPTTQCETCPNWYAGSDLAKATNKAFTWRKNNALSARYKKPSAALMRALEVLDVAIGNQEHEANERLRKQIEKDKKEREKRKKQK